MKHVKDAAIKLGINYIKIPAHEQSLNQAETVADRAFAAMRVHMVATGAAENLQCYALQHVCYMKLRMATSARRGWLTPFEIIKGSKPSIAHCMPWYTKAFVAVPKQKRAKLKREGLGNLRAEIGRLMGYTSRWGTTPLVMLDRNRLVNSRNVTYDITDFSENSWQTWTS